MGPRHASASAELAPELGAELGPIETERGETELFHGLEQGPRAFGRAGLSIEQHQVAPLHIAQTSPSIGGTRERLHAHLDLGLGEQATKLFVEGGLGHAPSIIPLGLPRRKRSSALATNRQQIPRVGGHGYPPRAVRCTPRRAGAPDPTTRPAGCGLVPAAGGRAPLQPAVLPSQAW